MILWLALTIPLVACILAYKLYGKKFVWWELLAPTVGSAIAIFIIKFSTEKSMLFDVQYRGGIIVEARYYEAWSTWVTQICTHTETCCCDSKGNNCSTITTTYDCSYCDNHSAYWEAYDDQGHSFRISKDEYLRLQKQWNATPVFVELNRDIDEHWSCGKDGDAYSISWNGNMMSVETSTWKTSYENYVQCAKSNFGLLDISKEQAKKFNLYEYPKVSGYHQDAILGLDSLKFLGLKYRLGAAKQFEYFNGYYGPRRKIRVFVLLYYNQPIDIAIKQKNYWVNGNKNEVVICIDVNKNNGEINWVYPFTWTENKRIEVDLREDITNMKFLNFTNLYNIVDVSTKEFKYRDFSKFDYLSVDSPTWCVWLVYILTFAITIGLLIYGYHNEFES